MPESDLYVPNSFTPDADEHNQSWGPACKGSINLILNYLYSIAGEKPYGKAEMQMEDGMEIF